MFTTPVSAVGMTVDPTIKLQPIPRDFLGLSTLKTSFCNTIQDIKNSSKFRQMMKNLAPANIRFGGSGQVDVFWYPNSYDCDAQLDSAGNRFYKVGTRSIDEALAILNETNWTMIYGLNIYFQSDEQTAIESKYVYDTLGSRLDSLAPNNEHDNFDGLANQWSQATQAILTLNPNAPISGPSNSVIATNFVDTFNKMIDQFHAHHKYTTFHYYSAVCTPEDPMGMILDHDYLDNRLATRVVPAITKSKSYGLPIRMAEGSTHSCGGTPGVSDAYGSALWGVDFLFSVLKLGVSGINFHGAFFRDNQLSYYSPISKVPGSTNLNDLIAQPLYYAMLLFKHAANDGYMVKAQHGSTTKNIRTFAVENLDGSLRVVLLNKDPTNVTFNINTTVPYTNASSIRLAGDDLYALVTSPTSTAVRLGGSRVLNNGSWQPTTVSNVAVSGTTSQVIAPPYTAIVVTYTNLNLPSPKPGDANNDGTVDATDFLIWTTTDSRADFDQNNSVDGRDFIIWLTNYGQ